MIPNTDGRSWQVLAPAKINLHLATLAKREDGFHELDTVIANVSVTDILVFRPSVNGRLTIHNHYWPTWHRSKQADLNGEDNLALQALRRMRQRAGANQLGGSLTLLKRIPLQAGLGGGSSDAAAALRLGNIAWGLHWPPEKLLELAAELGSDVPFFLFGGTARCRGRGERVEPLRHAHRLWVLIAKPELGLSTAQVFARHRIPANQPPVQRIIAALQSGRPRRVGELLCNQLQSAAFEMASGLSKIARCFAQLPCLGHQMTGSGSAYFGLFSSAGAARAAYSRLRSRIPEVRINCCQTLSRLPPVREFAH